MIITTRIKHRIMSTMRLGTFAVIAKTAEELNELGAQCCRILSKINRISAMISFEDTKTVLLEMADVLVMLTALQEALSLSDEDIEDAIIAVCVRWESE
jgi:hypothetical protein